MKMVISALQMFENDVPIRFGRHSKRETLTLLSYRLDRGSNFRWYDFCFYVAYVTNWQTFTVLFCRIFSGFLFKLNKKVMVVAVISLVVWIGIFSCVILKFEKKNVFCRTKKIYPRVIRCTVFLGGRRNFTYFSMNFSNNYIKTNTFGTIENVCISLKWYFSTFDTSPTFPRSVFPTINFPMIIDGRNF